VSISDVYYLIALVLLGVGLRHCVFSFYEDLYDLIKVLPLYHISPSGIPPPNLANDQNTVPEGSQWGHRKRISDTPPRDESRKSSLDSVLGRRGPNLDSRVLNSPSSIPFAQLPGRPKLRPARNPPKHSWTHFLSETVPLRYLPWAKVKRRRRRLQEMSYGYGGFEGDVDDQHSIPLEITLYMVNPVRCRVTVAQIGDLLFLRSPLSSPSSRDARQSMSRRRVSYSAIFCKVARE
jgi:hypothetical protein